MNIIVRFVRGLRKPPIVRAAWVRHGDVAWEANWRPDAVQQLQMAAMWEHAMRDCKPIYVSE